MFRVQLSADLCLQIEYLGIIAGLVVDACDFIGVKNGSKIRK